MGEDSGGWLWLLIDVAMVAVLGAALIYGMTMWRKRRRTTSEQVRDSATRELYHQSSRE